MRNILFNVPLSIAVAVGLSAAATTPGAVLAQAQSADDGPGNGTGTEDGPPEFTNVFGEPLEVNEPMEAETFTPAVEEFHATGENSYIGQEEAIAEGESLFGQECSACHGQTATGGMGPSLVDDTYAYERAATQQGMFEIIHGGAAGAMPAFGEQRAQDQILQIMAYIDSLSES